MKQAQAHEHRDGSNAIKQLGDYQLIKKLGQGAMGSVFLARQISLDREVALKVLPKSIAQDQTFIGRFKREAQASAKLNHPNIVQGIDVGQDEATGLWYFAMEFVNGPTLGQELKKVGRFSEQRALKIVKNIASALVCAEKQHIVHRDIKPDNIMLNAQGNALLADLGLAKNTADDASMTKAGMTVGTPHYMSPEQVRGENSTIDIRTDIYALGATLYHLVTGETPFKASTGAVLMVKHLNEPTPKAHVTNPEVSEACGRLILGMMQKKLDRRIATPSALIKKIDDILAGRTTGPRAPIRRGTGRQEAVARRKLRQTGPKQSIPERHAQEPMDHAKSPIPMILIGVGLILVLGGGAVLFSGNASPQTARQKPKRTKKKKRNKNMNSGPSSVASKKGTQPESKEQRGAQLLEEATRFSKQNPDAFDKAMDKYQRVVDKAAGTSEARQANARLKSLATKKSTAIARTWKELKTKVDLAVNAHQFNKALQLLQDQNTPWKEALQERTQKETAGINQKADAQVAKIAAEVNEFLNAMEIDKAEEALTQLKGLAYAPAEATHKTLKAALEARQIELAEEKKEEAERLATALKALLDNFDSALLNDKDRAGARKLIARAEKNDATMYGATLKELHGILDTYDDLDAQVIKHLDDLDGKEASLQTTRGPLNGTLKRLGDGVYELEQRIGKKGRSQGVAIQKLSAKDMSFQQRNIFLASWTPSQPAHWLAMGLQQAAGKEHEKAIASLTNAEGSPLHPHYKRVFRRLQVGAKNAAAEEAWQVIAAAASGELKHEGAEKLKVEIKAFLKTHGQTPFAQEIADKIETLKDTVAAAALPSSFTAAWVQKSPKAFTLNGEKCKLPPGRRDRGASYDANRNLGILCGSGAHQNALNDIWVYDLKKDQWICWLAHDNEADGETRPKAQYLCSASATPFCYDVNRDTYWLMNYNYLWAFDPEAKKWKKETELKSASLGYDPKARSLVTASGFTTMPEGYKPAVPETRKAPKEKPPGQLLAGWSPSTAQTSGSFTADEQGNFLVFGGRKNLPEKKYLFLSDTWSFSPMEGKWTRIETKESPEGRVQSNLAYNSRLKVWVLFGGSASKTSFKDTWVYVPHLKTWLQMKVEESPATTGAIWYDVANDQVVLFSGKGKTWALKIKPSFD